MSDSRQADFADAARGSARPGEESADVYASGPSGGAIQAQAPSRWTTWRKFRWFLRGAALLAVVWVFVVGCDSMFYFPTREVYNRPSDFNLKYEEVSFRTGDGQRLSGWFLPAQGTPRGTVVHFHGNAENMTSHISFVAWLPAAGYNLLVFDYRGYGASEGATTRAGTIRDGHAALDYVLSRPDVDRERVYFLGQSIGGSIAVVVAAERPEVRAIVVDSSFASYRGIARMHLRKLVQVEAVASFLARAVISSQYDPQDYVARIAPRPLLVIAGTADQTVYPEASRALFDAAGEPKEYWLIDGAAHTEAMVTRPEEASRRITGWFEHAGS